MSDTFRYLAANLRVHRALRRLSQAEVAAAAGRGFSQRYVSELERGIDPSDRKHIVILARVLGVAPDVLLRRIRSGARAA